MPNETGEFSYCRFDNSKKACGKTQPCTQKEWKYFSINGRISGKLKQPPDRPCQGAVASQLLSWPQWHYYSALWIVALEWKRQWKLQSHLNCLMLCNSFWMWWPTSEIFDHKQWTCKVWHWMYKTNVTRELEYPSDSILFSFCWRRLKTFLFENLVDYKFVARPDLWGI